MDRGKRNTWATDKNAIAGGTQNPIHRTETSAEMVFAARLAVRHCIEQGKSHVTLNRYRKILPAALSVTAGKTPKKKEIDTDPARLL